jgi:hypothetical protein
MSRAPPTGARQVTRAVATSVLRLSSPRRGRRSPSGRPLTPRSSSRCTSACSRPRVRDDPVRRYREIREPSAVLDLPVLREFQPADYGLQQPCCRRQAVRVEPTRSPRGSLPVRPDPTERARKTRPTSFRSRCSRVRPRDSRLSPLDTVGYTHLRIFRTPGCRDSSRDDSRQYEPPRRVRGTTECSSLLHPCRGIPT